MTLPFSPIPGHELRAFRFADHREEVIALRETVWRQSAPALIPFIFPNGFTDPLDGTAHHYGVFGPDGRLVAAMRFSVHHAWDTLPDTHLLTSTDGVNAEFPMASVNRLVVMPGLKGRGLSALLDSTCLNHAIRLGCRSVSGTTHGRRGLHMMERGYVRYDIAHVPERFAGLFEGMEPPAFFVKVL